MAFEDDMIEAGYSDEQDYLDSLIDDFEENYIKLHFNLQMYNQVLHLHSHHQKSIYHLHIQELQVQSFQDFFFEFLLIYKIQVELQFEKKNLLYIYYIKIYFFK